MNVNRRYALYIGNAADILDAKTANGFHFWRKEECIAEISLPGCAISTGLPTISLTQALERGANTLLIGVNPHGGMLCEYDIPVITEALFLGYEIISSLHTKISEIPEIVNSKGYDPKKIVELRHKGEKIFGTGEKRTGNRLLTVGSDSCVGKMFTALSIVKELQLAGKPCTFRATGQTGMMIAGAGVCVDAIIADYVAGHIEQLSPDNAIDHWDVIEGQGSLFHPAYANSALSLLHGSQPDVLVVCHEWGRTIVDGTKSQPIPTLREVIDLNLMFAKILNKNAKVSGISLNTRLVRYESVDDICKKIEDEFDLPCVDVLVHGAKKLLP